MPGTYEIIGKKNQTIIEVALQEYGSVEGVKYIIEDNSPTFDILIYVPVEGMSLTIRKDSVIDKKVLARYNKTDVIPANELAIVVQGLGNLPAEIAEGLEKYKIQTYV
jgi:hypothetical protein